MTASNFAKVCKLGSKASIAACVDSILYTRETDAMKWGKDNEASALKELQEKLRADGPENNDFQRCGLFIDKVHPCLACTPDALVGEHGIVEIKCPSSAKQYAPDDAIERNISTIASMFSKKGPSKLLPSHPYYFQVQGQLHITERDYCYFAVWTPFGIKYVKIMRDDEFWKTQMEPKLVEFYYNYLLAEILDSRKDRSMPRREYDRTQKKVDEERMDDVSNTCFDPEPISQDLSQLGTSKKRKHEDLEHVKVKMVRKNKNDYWRIIKSGRPDHVESVRVKVRRNDQGVWRVVEIVPRVLRIKHEEIRQPPFSFAKITNRPMPKIFLTPTDEEYAVLDFVNGSPEMPLIRANVTTDRSFISDIAIDLFLEIIKENTFVETQTCLWLSHLNFIHAVATGDSSVYTLHILGGSTYQHWRCYYFDGFYLFIYDSLGCKYYENLTEEEKDFISLRFPKRKLEKILFPDVAKQPDGSSCGAYAAAFATSLFLG